ncbi:PAS domain-containing hybrid sensor histidine kinase/response regulator [Gimesia maris]|uniref:histidine kinase n=1 Tax=Gimesia maris TaxID=122 RepID=A0ABX5YQD2_9PLAN|nr:PAS domain-containing hybrid sensor histidine kinase/response regulator [Gimesia maris]EDL60401.1 probable sensor/response regulator hybrid [Gimesia maris DSM 8797]QEG17833.1 Sensory/regulatory protein RpfC [Gimesia maris]QGQ29131.1 PAS domain-containing protein [Gimesia maris]
MTFIPTPEPDQSSGNQSLLIWASNSDQQFDLFNQAWLLFTNSTLEQNLNEGWQKFIHPNDLDEFLQTWHEAFAAQTAFQCEYRLKRADGQYRWFQCCAELRPSVSGELSGFFATSRDLLQQDQQVESSRNIEKHLEGLLSYSSHGVWDWLNLKSTEQWWSPRFYELIGYQNQEIDSSMDTLKLLLHPDDVEHTFQAFEDALINNSPFELEYRLRIKGGTYRWFRGYANVLRNDSGQAVRMTGSMTDIHLRVQTEEELRLARLEAFHAKEEKKNFLAMMSHEIRTPLTAILGYSEMILESAQDPFTQTSAETIHINGEYLLNTVNDFLDLSKIEEGRFDLELLECSPITVIENVRTLMRRKAEQKQLALKIACEHDLPETIKSDPIRLKQILSNILGLAIKISEKGSIDLNVSSDSDSEGKAILLFRVTFKNNKLDIDRLKLLFTSSQMEEHALPGLGGGTGLGLFVSKQLAAILGGQISVSKQTGDASQTSILLSIATGDLRREKMYRYNSASLIREIKSSKVSSDLLRKNSRILLVEDGIYNQRLIKFLLSKAGADVKVVEHGQQALDELQKNEIPDEEIGSEYDLILMDIQMPVLDGYTTTRRLRSLGFTKPIIALTANVMPGDREKCIAVGCDEYLSKPIDRKRLIETINGCLKKESQKNLIHQ